MHELSLALNLLELAEAEARRHESARVVALHVRIGPLSGVVREALISAYQMARADTPLAGAELVIVEAPLTIFCPHCRGAAPARSPQELRCAACGAAAERVLGGDELELTALELEA